MAKECVLHDRCVEQKEEIIKNLLRSRAGRISMSTFTNVGRAIMVENVEMYKEEGVNPSDHSCPFEEYMRYIAAIDPNTY
ncbi:hypothetical protein A3B56_00410 [Candidatus Roizmanbacteria bacterium RIFCSPLOWO2_01_FULL_45_11]|uniref:Uncharacterized protein n=1 Tax=Candidatus Roizmanbacteria bacterium RIFCSPLOWO2_01_FULL_45_11 TaxID=1802070 RepID=A0A1F7JDR1_9BACT|nr:MAG: hypothetical protein A3B56_00410 [Candidatus Roizmanbacteria bacterium RIFCSPLOWO2_01_FULL_45_11]